MRKGFIEYRSNYLPKWAYITTHPVFCWLRPSNAASGKFIQVTGWHGCRETFVTELKKSIVKEHNKEKSSIVIPHDRLRIGVMTRIHDSYTFKKSEVKEKAKAFQNIWMFGAVKVLNVVERHLKWSPTKLYKDNSVPATAPESRANIYIFVSSPKWLRSPQLLSLYLLLIRISVLKPIHKVHTVKDLAEAMQKIKRTGLFKNEKVSMFHDDISHANWVASRLEKIFENLDKLFFSRTLYNNYREQAGCYGITALVSSQFYGGDAYIKKRYKELVESSIDKQ